MAFSSISQLYNNLLVQDQPLVDSIVNHIKFKIEDHIATGDVNTFNYDTNIFLDGKDNYTKDRVIDQVLKIFRNIGIRVRVNGTGYNGYPFISQEITLPSGVVTEQINGEFDSSFDSAFKIYDEITYNSSTELSRIIIVEWFIRYRQEYMKHYC